MFQSTSYLCLQAKKTMVFQRGMSRNVKFGERRVFKNLPASLTLLPHPLPLFAKFTTDLANVLHSDNLCLASNLLRLDLSFLRGVSIHLTVAYRVVVDWRARGTTRWRLRFVVHFCLHPGQHVLHTSQL